MFIGLMPQEDLALTGEEEAEENREGTKSLSEINDLPYDPASIPAAPP